MFLTPEEIHALTGYTMPKHQRGWLTGNGWRYATNANGRPIVSRAHAEAMLGGVEAKEPPTPDFSVFAKAA